MDVDNSGHEHSTSCNQNTGKIGPKNYTTVKDAKKRSKKNTKTGSPLGNGGYYTVYFIKQRIFLCGIG